jgi:hypothetical protein
MVPNSLEENTINTIDGTNHPDSHKGQPHFGHSQHVHAQEASNIGRMLRLCFKCGVTLTFGRPVHKAVGGRDILIRHRGADLQLDREEKLEEKA